MGSVLESGIRGGTMSGLDGAAVSVPATLSTLVAQWPGPAAFIGPDGQVRCANAAAGTLLATLDARLGGLAAIAAIPTSGILEPVMVAGAQGPVTFEPAITRVDGGVLVTAHDISLTSNMRVALADSRRRYKDLVEISSDFAWETDASGAFVFVSPRGALGFAASELIGREASSLLLDLGDEADTRNGISPFAARRRVEAQEVWVRAADGRPTRVAVSAVPLAGPGGAYAGARGLCRDVTEAFERETALAEARHHERLLAYITRTIRDEVEPEAMLGTAAETIARALGATGAAIWRFGPATDFQITAQFGAMPPAELDCAQVLLPRLASASSGAADDTAVEIDVAAGKLIGLATSYRQATNGALMLWRSPERPGWSDSDRALVAGVAGQLGIAQAQIAQHAALARLASTDSMTGLLNRRSFTRALRRRLAQSARSRRSGALLYVDLDNFKLVNDRFGHQRGDEALKAVATRLQQGSRIGDFAARLGGDEFALWLEEVDLDGALAKAHALLAYNVELASFSGDPARPLGLSIGVALHLPSYPESEDALLARADDAMYRAKRGGKNGLVIAPMAEPRA